MLRKWFVYWHGEGAEKQADVYRCMNCNGLITWNMIRGGHVCCRGRLYPANPTFFEKFKLLVLPWMV